MSDNAEITQRLRQIRADWLKCRPINSMKIADDAATVIESQAQTIERLTRERDAASTDAQIYKTMLTEAKRIGFNSVIEALIAARVAVQELRNIAEAKRFDREYFGDQSAFGDWAQSRCRAAISATTDGGKT